MSLYQIIFFRKTFYKFTYQITPLIDAEIFFIYFTHLLHKKSLKTYKMISRLISTTNSKIVPLYMLSFYNLDALEAASSASLRASITACIRSSSCESSLLSISIDSCITAPIPNFSSNDFFCSNRFCSSWLLS